jgi:hypothetical protein
MYVHAHYAFRGRVASSSVQSGTCAKLAFCGLEAASTKETNPQTKMSRWFLLTWFLFRGVVL